MDYTLPKIWQARIPKYWDKSVPMGYPFSSSEFSVKYDTEEIRQAVMTMEETIGTDECVVNTMIPEGTFITSYVGTYEVKAESGVKTLLCPAKISGDSVVVMHYKDDEWVQVEDFEIEKGYVWGELEDFSPIAVFEYKKEIHFEPKQSFTKYAVVVCEGNDVKISTNDNNNTVVVNTATGTEIEVTDNVQIVGGSIDGSDIKYTSVKVIDLQDNGKTTYVYGGSFWYDESENSCNVDTINVEVINSTLYSVAGSCGAVRTNNVNIDVKDSVITNFISAGQSTITATGKDPNTANPTFASRQWVKNSIINIENTSSYIIYGGCSSGNTYTDNIVLVCNGVTSCDYFTIASSNGYTKKAAAKLDNCKGITSFQFTNRGEAGYVCAVVDSCGIERLALGGDNAEGDVDGTFDTIRLDVNSGNSDCNIKLGVCGDANTTADKVEAVKVSRSAGNVIVDEDVINVLGNKYVVK